MSLFDLYLKMKIIKIKVIIITVNIVKKSILINLFLPSLSAKSAQSVSDFLEFEFSSMAGEVALKTSSYKLFF